MDKKRKAEEKAERRSDRKAEGSTDSDGNHELTAYERQGLGLGDD